MSIWCVVDRAVPCACVRAVVAGRFSRVNLKARFARATPNQNVRGGICTNGRMWEKGVTGGHGFGVEVR